MEDEQNKSFCDFAGISVCNKVGLSFTLQDKTALYENCTIFDKSDLYGGPVCGDDGVTYSNSLYLDCRNHHSSDAGELISYCAINKN